MEIALQSPASELTPLLREQIHKMVRRAFNHVRHGAGRVVVMVRRMRRSEGGHELLAEVQVELPGGPRVVVSTREQNLVYGIDYAARRAAHRVMRLLALRRKPASPQAVKETGHG